MKATGASIRPYRQLTIFEASGIGNLKENTSTAKPLNQSRSGSHGSETLGESCVEGSSKDHPIICCDLSEDNSDVSSIGPLPLQHRSTGGGAKGFSQSTSDIHATGCSMLRGGERAEVSGNESTGESRTPTCDTDTEEDGRTDNANLAISTKLHKESACTGAMGNHGRQDGVTNLNFLAWGESSADPASKARQTNANRGSSVAMVTKEQLEKGQAQPMCPSTSTAGSVAMVTEKQLEKVDETTISKSTVSSVTSERHPSGGCGTAELPESPISETRKRKRVTRRLYSRRSKGTGTETKRVTQRSHHKRSKEAEGKGDVVKVSDDTPTIDSSCAVEPWRCENKHDGDSTPELELSERILIGRECNSETCMSNSTPEVGVATMDDTPTVATPTLDLQLVMSVKSPIKKKYKKVTRKLNSEHLTPKQTVGAIDAQDGTPTLTTPTLDCCCVYASGVVLRRSHDVCEDCDATNNEECENAVSLIKRKRKKASYRSFNRDWDCPTPECPTPIECPTPEMGVAFKSTTPSSTPKVGVACPDATPTSAITSCVNTGIDESDSSNMSRDIIGKSAAHSSKQKMGVSCPDATPTSAITSRVDTEELTLFAGDDESDSSSMSEVEHPLPSTPQQKEARRLARLKQLQEMRARETMEARRERAMKRRGESSPSKRPQRTIHKRVTWMEEGSLVTVVNCPPSDLQ